MAIPDRQLGGWRGGGGGGGNAFEGLTMNVQFWLLFFKKKNLFSKNKGEGRIPRAPPLDPPMG